VAALGQLAGEFDALCLATRERRRRLAQPHVAEPDVGDGLQVPGEHTGCSKNSSASATLIASTSAMVRPMYFTSSVSRL
jgi:hypothetical protein